MILSTLFTLAVASVSAFPTEQIISTTAGLMNSTSLSRRGLATWYDPSDPHQNEGYVNQGACGAINGGQWIVAWNNGGCGQRIGLRAFGKCADATVMDRCSSCGGDHVDLTPALFSYFTGLGAGQFGIDILPGGCGGGGGGGGGSQNTPPPAQGNKGIGAGCGADTECSKGCCTGAKCMDPCYCPNAYWKNRFCPNGPPKTPTNNNNNGNNGNTGIKGNGWKCVAYNGKYIAGRVKNGTPQCLSTDGKNCIWTDNKNACNKLINNQPKNQNPQSCGSAKSGWCKAVKNA